MNILQHLRADDSPILLFRSTQIAISVGEDRHTLIDRMKDRQKHCYSVHSKAAREPPDDSVTQYSPFLVTISAAW